MMKNAFLLPRILMICLFLIGTKCETACAQSSIHIDESNTFYHLKAKYNSDKTRKVQEYMTESLKETGFKFTNAKLDAQLSLTGGINFYIKSNDGELVLKFDKRKNNADDCAKFKKMCLGIKALLEEN